MASENKIVAFVPLHEEMRYIDSRLLSRGFTPFPDRDSYDRGRSSHFYVGQTSDRKKFYLHFYVLDASDRDVMGNISTAAHVLSVLGFERPNFAILIGLAGSLRPDKVRLGDVVVANSAKFFFPDKIRKLDTKSERFGSIKDENAGTDTATILVDERKRFLRDSFFRFRRDSVRNETSTERLVNYMDHIRQNPLQDLEAGSTDAHPPPSVHFGAILGSEWVVDSTEYVEFLLERDRSDEADWYVKHAKIFPATIEESRKRNRWSKDMLLAVDMESYGFLKAAEAFVPATAALSPFQAVVVRGISDLASEKSTLDRQTAGGERRRAVRNAAVVAIDFIARITEWGAGRSH